MWRRLFWRAPTTRRHGAGGSSPLAPFVDGAPAPLPPFADGELSLFVLFFLFVSLSPCLPVSLSLPSRRFVGTTIALRPDKYCPVSDLLRMTCFGVPRAVISPPWSPAPGPKSSR